MKNIEAARIRKPIPMAARSPSHSPSAPPSNAPMGSKTPFSNRPVALTRPRKALGVTAWRRLCSHAP